ASYIVVRLPGSVQEIFDTWLEKHYPNSRGKVLNRIREVHSGSLADSRFGTRMKGEGEYATQVNALFNATKRELKFGDHPTLSTEHFRRPEKGQLDIFHNGF